MTGCGQPGRKFLSAPGREFFIRLAVALLAAFVLASAPNVSAAEPEEAPDYSERLNFTLYLGLVPVGEASLSQYEVLSPLGAIRHFRIEADSFLAVDMVYKVRDRAEGVMDFSRGRSLWYVKSVLDNGGKVQETRFDWRTSTARRAGADDGKLVFLPPGTLDPLSVFYHLREMELHAFMVRRPWVTDGRRLEKVIVRVGQRETVRVPAGKYQAFRIDVDMNGLEGVLRTDDSDQFTIWVDPEQGNMPVKIVSNTEIGPFSGILKAVLNTVERP